MTNTIGIIILAAGSSSRMGKPKQLLMFQQQTLLDRIVTTATNCQLGPVIVVLGAGANLLHPKWLQKRVMAVLNENWEDGMSSSIQLGLQYLVDKYPSAEGVIFTVCDQPFISESLLEQLIEAHRNTKSPIAASSYDNVLGTPVFFHRSLFDELFQLNGDKGARQLVNKDSSRVAAVNFPLGNRDIDTPEDYERLIQNEEQ